MGGNDRARNFVLLWSLRGASPNRGAEITRVDTRNTRNRVMVRDPIC